MTLKDATSTILSTVLMMTTGMILVFVLLVTALNLSPKLFETLLADAQVACPPNSTWNGTTCLSTIPIDKVCPTGGTLQVDGTCLTTGSPCFPGEIAYNRIEGARCLNFEGGLSQYDGCYLGGTPYTGTVYIINGLTSIPISLTNFCRVDNTLEGFINQQFGTCSPTDLSYTVGAPIDLNVQTVLMPSIQLPEIVSCVLTANETDFVGPGWDLSARFFYRGGTGYGIGSPQGRTITYAAACPTGSTQISPTQCGVSTTQEPIGYIIDAASVGVGDCTTTTVVQDQAFNCSFPLTGSPNGIYLVPSEGLYAGILGESNNTSSFLGNSNLCVVSGSTLTCSTIPTAGSSTGIKDIVLHQPNVTWIEDAGTVNIIAPLANPTTVSPVNILDSGNCTVTNSVVVGQTYQCSFALTGDPNNNYQLPVGGVNASTSTASGQSQDCTILNNSTSLAQLICASIPTLNGTSGIQDVLLTLSSQTTDRGNVSLIQAQAPLNTNTSTNPIIPAATGGAGSTGSASAGNNTANNTAPTSLVRTGGVSTANLLTATQIIFTFAIVFILLSLFVSYSED